MKIILGSASKSRRRILERTGWPFEVMTADIDEKAIRSDDPKQLTLALARAKAEALLNRVHESAILITADQVVVCNGVIREKPENEAQAREYLESYATYPAEAVNGICVINTMTGKRADALDISKIKINPIPAAIINKLIEDRDIFSRAGGFSAEDPLLAPYVDYIEGTLDSIEGLPMYAVERLILEVK